MSFTAREEYGLRAVINIAMHSESTPMQSRVISEAEGIPNQFLEQVLTSLRRSGIVKSIRGASGGYKLARPAHMITASDVLSALGGTPPGPTPTTQAASSAVVDELWRRATDAMSDVLRSVSIRDLADEAQKRTQQNFIMMNI